jgi:hypothetical protein
MERDQRTAQQIAEDLDRADAEYIENHPGLNSLKQWGEAPPPAVLARTRRNMERGAALEGAEANLCTEREARDREARFAETLERHVEDRRLVHALRGVPEAIFEAELRPEIERKFLAREKDYVDSEHERRATSAY